MAKKSGFAAGMEAARKRRQKAKKSSGNVEAKSKAEIKPLPTSKPQTYRVQDIRIADIIVRDNRRELDDATVKELVKSISLLGLQSPIVVRAITRMDGWHKTETSYVLVSGLHRLEAMRQLGKATIPCFILKGDKRDARMWEISENLHRADLTAEEYDDQLVEWVRLFEANQAISGQNVQKKGPGRPESGISEAARQLPVKGKTHEAKRKRVARALKASAISSEAKEAAKKAGLNRSQRTKVAEEKTSEAQVAKVHELAARKSKTGKKRRSSDAPQKVNREADLETPLSADDKKYLADLVKKWNAARELKRAFIKASSTVREQFIAKIRQDRSSENRWIN